MILDYLASRLFDAEGFDNGPMVPSKWHPMVLFHDYILTTVLSRRRVRQVGGLILVNPPMINGEKYEFQAIRDPQLVKNVSEVMLGSLLTDA